MSDVALEIHDLTVSYDKKPVLWDVDLSLPPGKLIGILGPNGAGKSTLIKSVMGLVPNSSGYIRLFDTKLDEIRSRVSYVPQRESEDWDFPASVLDVVLIVARRKGGLEAYSKRQISLLSGGQQQRGVLAWALAQQADLYFMDEPFAGVDAATEKTIIDILKEMTMRGNTVVVVHHDLQSVQDYFDWVILLNMRLVAYGPTKEVFNQDILQETYGGKLTLLSDVWNLLKTKRFPNREFKPEK